MSPRIVDLKRRVSNLRSSGEYRCSNHQTKYRIYFSRYILPLVYNICQSTAERNFSRTTKIAGNHWLSEEIGEISPFDSERTWIFMQTLTCQISITFFFITDEVKYSDPMRKKIFLSLFLVTYCMAPCIS